MGGPHIDLREVRPEYKLPGLYGEGNKQWGGYTENDQVGTRGTRGEWWWRGISQRTCKGKEVQDILELS